MIANRPKCCALLLIVFCFTTDANAQPRWINKEQLNKQIRSQVWENLGTTRVELSDLAEDATFLQVLEKIQSKMPEGKKIRFRIDKAAFGADYDRIANTKVDVRAFSEVLTAIKMAIERSKLTSIDFAIDRRGVVFTHARLAAHTESHNISTIVNRTDVIRQFMQMEPDSIPDIDPKASGSQLLTQLILTTLKPQSWESIRIVNGTKLLYHASPIRQMELNDLIQSISRLTDLAVVMNARIYEVDREFYTKRIQPLLKHDKAETPSALVTIDETLFRAISRKTQILKSDDVKLRPRQKVEFLSQQQPFQFNRGSQQKSIGTEGISFEVRPIVSTDRRQLRLEITQNTSQLLGIEKTRVLNPASGREEEVDTPNVRKSTTSGSIDIADGHPILMPIGYRPGNRANDKVWILVARPFIWIEAEAEYYRKEGGSLTSQNIWGSDIAEPSPSKLLKLDDDNRDILQAVITDLLTNPKLKEVRNRVERKSGTITLTNGSEVGWPKDFKPYTHHYEYMKVDPFEYRRPNLEIVLERFDLKLTDQSPIQISFGNYLEIRRIIGGEIEYVPERVNDKWTVKLAGPYAK